MVISCQECGKEVEERFQFCPFCGKKLIKPKICSNCGFKLKENFMFCPDCGKKWDSSEKTIMPKSEKERKTGVKKAETIEKVEETKPLEEPKSVEKVEPKAALPKISRRLPSKLKMPGKKVLMIISVIGIVLVAVAAMILFNPFDTNGTSSGGGTFSVTVENNYSDSVEYYFIIDDYYNIGSLNTPYTLLTDDSMTFNINENDLTIPKNQHKVTLSAYVNDGPWISETTSDVTESATFEISGDNGSISVNCTGSQ